MKTRRSLTLSEPIEDIVEATSDVIARKPPKSKTTGKQKTPSKTKSPSPQKTGKSRKQAERSRSRSPARSKSPARSSSPARSKSPARSRSHARSSSPARSRSPARSKSPARTNSPARSKSPARNKSPVRSKKPASSKSPDLNRSSKSGNSSNSKNSKAAEIKSSSGKPIEEPRRTTRKIRSLNESNSTTDNDGTKLTKRTVEMKTSEANAKYKEEKQAELVKPSKSKYNYMGMGKCLMWNCWELFVFVSVSAILNGIALYTQLNCNKGKDGCLLNRWPRVPQNLLTVFNVAAFMKFFAVFLAISAFTLVPLGKVILSNRLRYRINGLYCMAFCLSSFAAAVYMGLPVADLYFIQSQLIVAGSLLCFLLCFVLFFLSWKVVGSGSFLNDLFYGKVDHPRLGMLDFKTIITLKAGHYFAAAVYLSYAYVDYQAKKGENLNISLLIACAMQLSYTLLYQILEKDLVLSSMLIKTDRLSYAKMFHHLVMVPFVMTLPGRFLLEHEEEIKMPLLCAIGCLVPFVIGATLSYHANHVKALFKQDPDAPATSHLLSITSGRGEREIKLICSGLYGLVRHPNYFGDLLMHFSIALLTGHASAIPYLPFIYLLTYCVCRIWRMEKFLSKRSISSYSAWNQYAKQVSSRLVVKVF